MLSSSIVNNFFNGSESSIRPLILDHSDGDWFFYIIIAILALLAWSRNFSPYRFFFILNSFFSYRKTEILHNQGKVIRNGTSFAFILITIFSAGIFIYQFAELFNLNIFPPGTPPYLYTIYLSFAVGGIWLTKSIIVLITGTLFKTYHSSSLYLSNILIVNTFGSIILMVFIVIYYYTKNTLFLYLPIYFLLLIYIYRLIRSFLIGRKAGKFSILYIILYLCTLEILPVLVLYKLVKDYIFSGVS